MTPEERQAVINIKRQAVSALVLANRLLGLPDRHCGMKSVKAGKADRKAGQLTQGKG